ncbi:magnesium-translocating P-type ATPase [Tetragenococcus solitarius]|uniref:Magnesium-transporting ATPase, P-type 1 n=1 Tax=Tetragenococcus solitarius TaxID=71453 RepID=A0ABP6KXI8_9ENTE|nr:magnesium-translocating P-type ATPase [Tetragenococcus solitarius]
MRVLQNKEKEMKQLGLFSKRELMMSLRTSENGLTEQDAKKRLEEYGKNQVNAQKPLAGWKIFLHAFYDPFVFVLAFLMVVSFLTNDLDAAIVMAIMILASAFITFVQEYRSQKASIELKEFIENTCAITREGQTNEISMEDVVPGDLLTLETGDMIPADAVLIWTKDLFVNQSSLTGESMPVEKLADVKHETIGEGSAVEMPNLVFMGTDVLSGQAKAIILKTGQNTFFGDIAQNATKRRNTTSFDRGLSQISKLLLRMVFILFPIVFVLNGLTKGDWAQAFFFAIAVAVGLTPEMLPMIVTTNLAKGAMTLSKEKVIVKELPSIQNLGSMNVLCTDKTGTITEDRVVLVQHLDSSGNKNDEVLDVAYMNAFYQTGWKNLMDEALIDFYNENNKRLPYNKIEKIDEIPFDFARRRQTAVVKINETHQLMITKGAVEEMEEACSCIRWDKQTVPLTDEIRKKLRRLNRKLNEQGMRVLTVATKMDAHNEAVYSVDDEKDMQLLGFICFLDPAKETAKSAIDSLQSHGVAVKVLTGDNDVVAKKVCHDVGIEVNEWLLGNDIEKMTDEELADKVDEVHLFAKLNPQQKSRIIATLQTKEHTVGFMGDGINDAPALRTADVGISVDTAADITRDASSIILLEKSLNVLSQGVIEGRRVFANMMKYIKMTISSNFGNVFTILAASAFLPFLPMLSLQLLVQNLIYDMAQLTLPWDNVDDKELQAPVKWKVKGLLKFTLCIGPISSIFDIATFLVMWYIIGANTPADQNLFQTGWFAIGLVTQTLVVHFLRTSRRSLIESQASWQVTFATVIACLMGGVILLTPLREAFDFVQLPNSYWIYFFLIVAAYLLTVEGVKRFYIALNEEWL